MTYEPPVELEARHRTHTSHALPGGAWSDFHSHCPGCGHEVGSATTCCVSCGTTFVASPERLFDIRRTY